MNIDFGKIYFFRYNQPVTKNIKIWDKAPLVIPLAIHGQNLLAINLHWLPLIYRAKFILTLIQMTDTLVIRGKIKMLLRLTYDMMKTGPLRPGLYGIRKYRMSRMSSIVEIPAEQLMTLKTGDGKYKKRTVRRK